MIRKKLIYEEFENIEESKDIDDIENESGTTSTPRKEVVEKIDISKLSNDNIKFGATIKLIDDDTEEEIIYQIVTVHIISSQMQ